MKKMIVCGEDGSFCRAEGARADAALRKLMAYERIGLSPEELEILLGEERHAYQTRIQKLRRAEMHKVAALLNDEGWPHCCTGEYCVCAELDGDGQPTGGCSSDNHKEDCMIAIMRYLNEWGDLE